MAAKLVPPKLDPVGEPVPSAAAAERPDLRTTARRPKPVVDSLIAQGFVTEAVLPERIEPDDILESITIEVPRRLKRALHSEVAARRDDPARRSVASMKSVILEALAAYGFGDLIRPGDIEVQAGIFMKRQSAQMRRR
ncbi:MAG TPA: hypothetical protein VHT21_13515 [Stellaceae bacterium]|jgi:hypothetical protein|nr:hypothetical protein [Stellaceae bacterium]